ncbi:hypothetical protein [Inconstantimicrobium mannanitabidum]|uniref:Phosphopentomutase n=1 Tax=Inconstantimicrobium mannanitabidum TaxID=1604901 RepID=A0ACB5RH21_9CLOT|nr:hypothetical protein [Clostridium sp. TW13]GKX68399.1 phosphopentomutase [Clostridium sp. TW13]
MNVYVLSIDALGIGATKDYRNYDETNRDANTLERISASYPDGKINHIRNLVNKGRNNERINYYNGKKYISGYLELGYLGADSYIGHQAMMGRVIKEPIRVFLEDICDNLIRLIKEEYPSYEIRYENGLLFVSDKFILGNNAESDLGLNLNLLALKKEIDFDELKKFAGLIRENSDFERIICMYNNDIDLSLLYKCINTEEVNGRVITRFRVAPLNLYNENYKVYHWCKQTDNTLVKLLKKNVEVNLVGKTADMFDNEKFKKHWFSSIDETFNFISNSIKQQDDSKDRLFFINLQEIDLCGHAKDLNGGVEALVKINDNINNIISEINEDECLIITADHGNDPLITPNHTRENVPYLLFGKDSVLSKSAYPNGGFELSYISEIIMKVLS